MTSVKDRHYWSQLRAALTGGQWLAQHPAKTPHGAPLSWSELLRKFNKHCKGFKDVAEVASQTQGLALLLSASSLNEDEDRESDVELFQLQLDGECILPEERVGEATSGYETLKTLETSNFDTINLALAYYAYALGNPSDCISHLSKISNLYQTVPIVGSFGSSTTMLTVPGAGSQSIATSASGSFVSFADMTVPEVKDGRGWAMTETFRSICLHGMSHEQLYPTEVQKALKAYREAIPLFATLQTEYATISTPSSTGKPDWTSFVQLRELWRWVERLIWRGVVLSSRHRDQESLWAWLNHYNTTSTCWPPTFRTSHRSTISTIHLRALILRHGCLAPSPLHLRKSAAWVHTARSVIQDYRAILSMCTKFPRAGERNVRVEEFVDLCVAVWEGSGAVGEHAGWVLDILWWATRLTFNSSRILRHMTRLLYLSGDVPLAKRTLRLYIQVVGKSYEASKQDIGEDIDTDDNWVETLVFGARMLCRHASAVLGVEGLEDVKEAGTVLEKARTRLDKDNVRLRASIEQAEGIIKSLLAIKEEDPYTRPQRVAEAHAHLLKSVELHPTSSGHYHLAISFSRPGPHRDMEQAIEQAGMAVEADPTEVRYWHLLGLLLMAVEKWVEAVEILEHGAELDDSYSCEREKGEARVNGDVDRESDVRTVKGGEVLSSDSVPNGNASGVFVAPNGQQQQQNGVFNKDETTDETHLFLPILEEDALEIPPAAGLFKSILRVPIPSEHNIFEYSLQLRMTQVALTEVREGAEGAEQQWLEVFAWIAEKKGLVCESAMPRSSIDGPGPTLDMNALPQDQEKHAMANGDNPPNNELPPPPIPIMISPATPIIETAEPGEGSPTREKEKRGADKKHSHHTLVKKSSLLAKSSSSFERDREGSKSTKKINQMLKSGVRGVHKSGARLTAVSRKIGSGVVRNGSLRRSTSTPDFHAVLRQTSYQASSIHSRRRLSSIVQSQDGTPSESPPPPPPPPPPQAVPPPPDVKLNSRLAKEKRMLSDLWLMSAATFRRLGKIEQAKGAIQEAEVRDENNPAVWVQLALYYVALGHHQHAIDALQKALFISPYDVSATVHLGRLYLTPNENRRSSVSVPKTEDHSSTNMDLAASLLGYLTKGRGWDVPEAWYFLAKAYGMQGRKERERDALALALELSEHRGVREIGAALGWCI